LKHWAILLTFFGTLYLGGCSKDDTSLLPNFRSPLEEPVTSSVNTFRTTDGREIIYLAIFHTKDLNSPVMKQIKKLITEWKPEFCVLEGFDETEGISPERVRKKAQKVCQQGNCSENLYAALLCDTYKIPFIGGDIKESFYLEPLGKEGFSLKDIAFYLLALQIPYFHRDGDFEKRDGKFRIEDSKRVFESYLREQISSWLEVPISYTYEEFLAWHKKHMGKPYDPSHDFVDMNSSELSPSLEANATLYQKISAHTMLIRESQILKTIKRAASQHRKVLVIYGASHFEWEKKVLSKYFGTLPQREFLPQDETPIPSPKSPSDRTKGDKVPHTGQ
jgi:hypothetical protein